LGAHDVVIDVPAQQPIMPRNNRPVREDRPCADEIVFEPGLLESMNKPAPVRRADVRTGPHDHPRQGIWKLAVGAIGIVFGDIGTSPIYAFRETFVGHHPIAPDPLHVHGVLSLIFWSMMVVVTIKYVGVIMRADNKGEGGSLALLALISREIPERRWTGGIVLLGVFACALFYGDSMITPAISVLSAVEGLQTVEPRFGPFVVPIAVIILMGLFSIQSHGTRRVGSFFGPIMLLYFATISVFGIMHIAGYPAIVHIP
jgi:KUP system potassium uptake protein